MFKIDCFSLDKLGETWDIQKNLFSKPFGYFNKDFQQIEKKFLELARGKHEFKMRSVSKADALALYEEEANPYKVELI